MLGKRKGQSQDRGTRAPAWRLAAIAAVAFLIFLCVAIVLTYPLVTGMSRQYFNPTFSHDGVGTISLAWYGIHAGRLGYDSPVTTFFAYPFGYDTHAVYYPLVDGLIVTLGRAIGPQAAFNVLILLSFPVAGLLMFLLLYYITSSIAAGMLGGFLYAFSPWHIVRSFDQVSLAQIYVLPLFLICVIYLWRRRSVVAALAVSASMLVALFTDLHLGLFCGFILVVWGMAAFLSGEPPRVLKRRPFIRRDTLRVIIMAVLAVVLALAVAAPVMRNLFYKDPAVITETGERSIETTSSYSSRPWNYVVPPAYALAWRWWTDDFVSARLGKSGVHEVTAYPGIVTYALAAVCVFYTFRRRRKRPAGNAEEAEPSEGPASDADAVDAGDLPEDTPPDRRTAPSSPERLRRTAVYFGMISAAVAFLLSMPPVFEIGGVQVPTPSIVIRAVAPFFRFYSRWALVFDFSIVILAAIGFVLLAKNLRWSRLTAGVVCFALIALFALDVTIVPPARSRDITEVPRVVTALKDYPREEPVVFYPLSPGRYFIPLQYRYYQTFEEHPMLNYVKPGTEGDTYQGVLKDIYAPYTPEMLAGLGIKKVAVIDNWYEVMFPVGIEFDPSKMPPGYRLLQTLKEPDAGEHEPSDGEPEEPHYTYLYEVVAPPAAVFPLYYTNFTATAILEDGKAWTAMRRPRGEMLLENKGPATVKDFSFEFNDPTEDGVLTVSLNGRAVGRVNLRVGPGELTIKGLRLKKGSNTLTMEWSAQPTKTDGAPFGAEGEIDLYLFITRPSLSPVDG